MVSSGGRGGRGDGDTGSSSSSSSTACVEEQLERLRVAAQESDGILEQLAAKYGCEGDSPKEAGGTARWVPQLLLLVSPTHMPALPLVQNSGHARRSMWGLLTFTMPFLAWPA